LCALAGCQNDGAFLSKLNPANLNPKEWFGKPAEAPPAAVDNYVMKGGGLEKDQAPESGTAQADLEGAKTLYSQGKYAEAEKIFHRLAYNNKNSAHLCEEALFFEADCMYMQGKYPKAESTYK
jgi:TolA-binding protein